MSKRWIYWLLCAAALALVVANVALQLRGAAARGPDPMKSLLSATLSAKVAVLLGDGAENGTGTSSSETVVQALDEAARESSPPGRARALRRKAIWCSFKHLGCATAALDGLAEIPAGERAPAPEGEVEVLREVLGGAPIAKERAPALEGHIAELHLGWFDHLLRERLQRNAGDTAKADEALARARSGAVGSVAAILAFGALMAGGAVAWFVVLFLPARRRVLRRLREHLAEREVRSDADAARLMAVFVVFLGAALGLGPLVRALRLSSLATTPVGSALLALGGEVALGLVVIVTHRLLSWGSVAPPPVLGFTQSSPRRAAGVGALVYLLLLPAIFVILIPFGALFDRLGIPTQGHPIVDRLQDAAGSPAALAVWLVVAAVAAPLLEEAVFRGALQGGLRARFGGWQAIAIASVAFAVIHPQVGLGLVGVLVIGVTLALVREHERSLWPSVVVHALNNGVALALAMGMLSG